MNLKAKAEVQKGFVVDEVYISEGFNLAGVEHEKLFTWFEKVSSPKNSKALSLKGIERLVNTYAKRTKKESSDIVLKGLFRGGYKGEHTVKTAPFLFFDIDVKSETGKRENTHLINDEANEKVFLELQKIAVFVWRSHSKKGIAGILHVPQIAEYYNGDTDKHLKAGKAITGFISQYLQEKTGFEKITFDPAQNKFRQVRFIANQWGAIRNLNPDAVTFSYKSHTETKRTKQNVTKFRNADNTAPYGSVKEQYNSRHHILDIMLKNGFSEVGKSKGKIRVKHIATTSSTSGEVNLPQNIYYNFSQSFGNKKSYTPADLTCMFSFGGDYRAFYKHLYAKGYRNKELKPQEVKKLATSLKPQLEKAKKESETETLIFEHTYHLRNAADEVKQKFIKENCTAKKYLNFFYEYLQYTDYRIQYDKVYMLESKGYVSACLPQLLTYSEQYTKTLVKAETGLGKTTAFIQDFHKYRPKARILILEPLTVIVNQLSGEYAGKGVFLTGESPTSEHIQAFDAKMVVATYNQGLELINHPPYFDCIVIDEAHHLITAHGYKADVLEKLTFALQNAQNVIGLTGTPNQIFTNLGFQMVEVVKKDQVPTKVTARFSNIKPYKLAINHILNAKGKILIRLNEVKTMEGVINYLVKKKFYTKEQILLFHSTKEIKESDAFKELARKGCFPKDVKLVFTTSLIDEGLSIEQSGFTDVVFIETSYIPRPEAAKQYFARFRNQDKERKNYLYLRTKNDQTPTKYQPCKAFETDKEILEAESNTITSYSTYYDIFSNDSFFYTENHTLNLYYLAYQITGFFSITANTTQFINYLRNNYNLSVHIDKDFEAPETKYFDDTRFKNQLKTDIANVWVHNGGAVLNILKVHSEKKGVQKHIAFNPLQSDTTLFSFVIKNLKDFERLFIKTLALQELGEKIPDNVLITDGRVTSHDKVKKAELVLRAKNVVTTPKSKEDHKNRERLFMVCKECEAKKRFTYAHLCKILKKHRVFNSQAYTFESLQDVFACLGYGCNKHTKGKIIDFFKLDF